MALGHRQGMSGLTLSLNAGSSSFKFAAFRPGGDEALRGQISPLGDKARLRAGDADEPWPHGIEADGIGRLIGWISEHDGGGTVSAIGHRVVHGGKREGPARVDDALLAELTALVPLAPLHQPHSLAAIHAVASARPKLPQAACFDTSFHCTMDALARTLPLPAAFRDAGAEHYGFHGISYQYVASRLGVEDPALAAGRVIVAHLGSGASLCAIRDGRSIDTTMGMTALDGLIMGTRTGRLDPGVVLWMAKARGMTPDAIEDTLYHRSGLQGISGASADLRDLAPDSLAARMFVRSVVREAGALASVLGGIDGFVFAGGIGEHQAGIRAAIAEELAWLGPKLDPALNESYRPDPGPGRIGDNLWVIPTDEEYQIAMLTEALFA